MRNLLGMLNCSKYILMDVHRAMMMIVFLDAAGKVLAQTRIQTQPATVKELTREPLNQAPCNWRHSRDGRPSAPQDRCRGGTQDSERAGRGQQEHNATL